MKIRSTKTDLNIPKNRLDVEIKDIKKQITGIKSNMESIIDIVKVTWPSNY